MTQQETEEFIFGAGIPDYFSWWHSFGKDWQYDDDLYAPDGWTYLVVAEDPENPTGTIQVTIDHKSIVKACRAIIHGKVSVNSSIKGEAANLLFDTEECDIDAIAADAILQVAVYGGVIFG